MRSLLLEPYTQLEQLCKLLHTSDYWKAKVPLHRERARTKNHVYCLNAAKQRVKWKHVKHAMSCWKRMKIYKSDCRIGVRTIFYQIRISYIFGKFASKLRDRNMRTLLRYVRMIMVKHVELVNWYRNKTNTHILSCHWLVIYLEQTSIVKPGIKRKFFGGMRQMRNGDLTKCIFPSINVCWQKSRIYQIVAKNSVASLTYMHHLTRTVSVWKRLLTEWQTENESKIIYIFEWQKSLMCKMCYSDNSPVPGRRKSMTINCHNHYECVCLCIYCIRIRLYLFVRTIDQIKPIRIRANRSIDSI